jgi:hypothetical protein
MRRFCVGMALAVGLGVLAAPAAAGITMSIALTPESATNPVGTSHTVTATVSDVEGPRAFVFVQFAVTAGPNIGETGSGCTDDEGKASFTYTSNGVAGEDTITGTVAGFCGDLAAVSALGGQGPSDTATKTWVAESPAPPPAAPPSPVAPPAPSAAAPGGALPFTGMPVWIVLLAAAGLIGAGALLLVPRTRKSR